MSNRQRPVHDDQEPRFVSAYRMRCRSVAGIAVTNLDDEPYPQRADGWQDLEFQGATELLRLIEFWGCPVTIAPPENGCEFWSLELEDGKHDELGSMLDESHELTMKKFTADECASLDGALDEEFPS